jgi:UDP-galactopyranose mutase
LAANSKQVSFLGRLATYRYMDMHHVIGEALQFSALFIESLQCKSPRPIFPNVES